MNCRKSSKEFDGEEGNMCCAQEQRVREKDTGVKGK